MIDSICYSSRDYDLLETTKLIPFHTSDIMLPDESTAEHMRVLHALAYIMQAISAGLSARKVVQIPTSQRTSAHFINHPGTQP